MGDCVGNVVGVGYQGVDAVTFVDDLLADGVHTVVDVRLTPISRKKGLSKRSLSERLAHAGISYEHLRVLGNPKWNRAGFAGSDDDLTSARQTYAGFLDTDDARAALDRIESLASAAKVALLCFEADGRRCHRAVLLDMLARRSAPAPI